MIPDVISNQGPKFNSGLAKLPVKLEHVWLIASQREYGKQLLIHATTQNYMDMIMQCHHIRSAPQLTEQ